MHIASDFRLRTRRAILAAGGAALVGCATLGAVSLGVANAQSAPATPSVLSPTLSTSDNAGFVTFDAAQMKQQQDKFISTLAGKLGVTSDKLQQALKDTQQELGPTPMLFGPGADGIGIQGTAISISSPLAGAAKAIGISDDDLRKEIVGKSLTDVAKAHSIDPQRVASAIKAARITELDQAVQAGKLQSKVADSIKSNLDKEMEMLLSMVHTTDGGIGVPGVRGFQVMIKDPTAP